MNVLGFKDVTGQEFIAELVNENNGDTIIVKNPICLVPTEKGMMPVPYILTSQGTFYLKKSSLLFEPFSVESNIADFYKQKFKGIIEPPNGLIL